MAQTKISPSQKKIAVARVNGVEISAFQVEAGMHVMLDPYRDTKGKVRLSQPEQYAARKHVIDSLIARELLYQEGCRTGLKAGPAEIKEALQRSMEEYAAPEQFRAMLAGMGLSPEEYRQQLEHDIVINKVAAAAVAGKKKPVTAAETRAYYDGHPEEMTGPELRSIMLLSAALDRYAAVAEAEQARRRLQPATIGADSFAKLFRRPAPGLTAEDLGLHARGQIHPLLDSIAFRSPVGQPSRIIRTEEALHVLMVPAVLPEGKVRPFELVKGELKNKIYEMRSVAMVRGFVDRLRAKAVVDILDRLADSKLQQELGP